MATRRSVDLPTGPREAKSTGLSAEDKAIIVAFRRHTLLPYAFLRRIDVTPLEYRLRFQTTGSGDLRKDESGADLS